MKRHTNKHFILLLIVALTVACFQAFFKPAESETAVATSFCTSEKCKAAAAAEQEAIARANNATEAANTLEAEVQRLNEEIAMYEARIVANQAVAEDLKIQIEENTMKLELQQQALMDMLLNMHFEGETDAIMLLASSSSLSDYAEKQSRADTAKAQISVSAQTVKVLKEDLEAQKSEVERIIADQEIQKTAIQNTKAQQSELVAKYQENAAAYTAEAEAARAEKEQEMEAARLAMIQQLGGTGAIVSGGVDTYPFANECPQNNLFRIAYGGYECQCTSYAGWMAYNAYGVMPNWGNANTWDNVARALGYTVDGNPEVGTIAQTDAGWYGHVMWVEMVYGDGTILISEYNGAYTAAFSMRRVPAAGYNFIHLR